MVAAPPRQVLDREALFGRRIALVSVTLGLLLASTKIWIGTVAGSAAVISDGFETGGDVFSSAMVYAGLWLASKPPDYEHPYGHGRYETLAGLAVGGLLLITGTAIFWNGLVHFHENNRVEKFALYPLVAAVAAKMILALTKFRVGRRIASTALEADAWHDVTDLVSTTIAIVATSLVLIDPERFGIADRIGGMLIGIIIFLLSIQVVRRVVGQLLDTMPDPALMSQIREVALRVPGAVGIEKCFARRTGMKYHVDLHLEVDGSMTVRESHEIASLVRHAVKEQLSWVADVLIHVEPAARASLSSAMENKQIAQLLSETADLMEVAGEDGFRIRSYRNAAAVIATHPERIADIVCNSERKVTDIPGIGKGLSFVLAEICERGSFDRRDQMLARYPASALELLKIQGLGPKSIALLYEHHAVKTVDDLERLCLAKKLRELPRMEQSSKRKCFAALKPIARLPAAFC